MTGKAGQNTKNTYTDIVTILSFIWVHNKKDEEVCVKKPSEDLR